MFSCLFVFGELPLLLERGLTDLAFVRSQICVDSEMVFDVAVFVKIFMAVGAEVHGVVPSGFRVVYFLCIVYSFIALDVLGLEF